MTQIIVLDLVFSLDSVITAVGMVDELFVMMTAVVIAVIVMIAASKPLTTFINAHPPLVILCLGFLLMVGFSLIADGLGYHIPKGYLYAAIGFSVVIEIFNQIAQVNRSKSVASIPVRQRTADAVLRLLAGVPLTAPMAPQADANTLVVESEAQQEFGPAEKEMVRGVLQLADRTVGAIMTPRTQLHWIDANDSPDSILTEIRNSARSTLLVGRGSVDEVIGIVRKEDILELFLDTKPVDIMSALRAPVMVPQSASILETLEHFKRAPIPMVVVIDEYGGVQGVVTRTDILEAIAGDLPDAEDNTPEVVKRDDGSMLVDGAMSVFDVRERLDLGELPQGDFNTLAGFVLFLLARMPAVGDQVLWNGWQFEIAAMNGRRIEKILVRRVEAEAALAAAQTNRG